MVYQQYKYRVRDDALFFLEQIAGKQDFRMPVSPTERDAEIKRMAAQVVDDLAGSCFSSSAEIQPSRFARASVGDQKCAGEFVHNHDDDHEGPSPEVLPSVLYSTERNHFAGET
jgi:hypothetical protein